MVASRGTRLVGEALLAEGTQASVTRTEQEFAGLLIEATTGVIFGTRLVGEVVRAENPSPMVTRTEQEWAGLLREPNSGTILGTRLVGEVLIGDPAEPSVTRTEQEWAGLLTEPNGAGVFGTRIVAEVLSRQGSAGPITPLPLNPDSDFFLHNWVSKVRLSTSYNTDIQQSPVSGAESRRGLVLKPYRTLQVEWLGCEQAKLDRMLVVLRRMTDQRIQVPLYQDQQELARAYSNGESVLEIDTTEYRLFPGARIVIVELDGEEQVSSWSYHTISATTGTTVELDAPLGQDIALGSFVMPVMDAELVLEADYEQDTAGTMRVSAEFAEVPGASALPPLKSDNPSGFEVFEDRPIWDIEPNWLRGIERGRRRQGRRFRQGRADLVSAKATRSVEYHRMRFDGVRSKMWRAIEFFDTRRGALRTFWHIDQDQTLNAVELDATGNFVGVSETGDFPDFNEEWDHVGIVMDNGDVYVREVVTVQPVLTVYRLTVTPPLPAGLDVNNVARLARARITRFESDEMEEDWETTGFMATRLSFIEALDENDYPTT